MSDWSGPTTRYEITVLGADDVLAELGDALRSWANPRGRRFFAWRSLPAANPPAAPERGGEALREVLARHVEQTVCDYDLVGQPCGFEERHAIHDLYPDVSKRAPLHGINEKHRHVYHPTGRGICVADEDEWPCAAARLAALPATDDQAAGPEA